jgi:prophage regulatory protein
MVASVISLSQPAPIPASQHHHAKPAVLLRLPEVMRRTALGKTTVYMLIKAGAFPAQIPLGGKSVAFLEADIEQWIQQRIAAARGAA